MQKQAMTSQQQMQIVSSKWQLKLAMQKNAIGNGQQKCKLKQAEIAFEIEKNE